MIYFNKKKANKQITRCSANPLTGMKAKTCYLSLSTDKRLPANLKHLGPALRTFALGGFSAIL
jgi:hypothetical protein